MVQIHVWAQMIGELIWYWQFNPEKDKGRYCLVIDESAIPDKSGCDILILCGKEQIWISDDELNLCKEFENLEKWATSEEKKMGT